MISIVVNGISTGTGTYTNTVLKGHAPDGQRLEQLGDGLAVGLRVGRRTSCRFLGRGEVGNSLCGLVVDVGEGHGVVVVWSG